MEDKRINDLLEQVQKQCLLKGVGGIKGLAVVFRNMDTDFSKRLCYEEFSQGIRKYGLNIREDDLVLLFKAFDRNNSNQIDFMEMVLKLQPPMPEKRIKIINQAFNKLDANKDGVLKTEDLKVAYSKNIKKHPKCASGEWTEKQALEFFLNTIDTPGNPDGKVTRDEFMNYYAGVSSTIDDDCYFDLMMRTCYQLPDY